MKKIVIGLAAILLFAAMTLAAGPASAKADKVFVCHFTGSTTNPIKVLSVSQNAEAAHLAHGDWYFTSAGKPLQEVCVNPDPVETDKSGVSKYRGWPVIQKGKRILIDFTGAGIVVIGDPNG